MSAKTVKGSKCKRGHDGTRYEKSGVCVECASEYNRARWADPGIRAASVEAHRAWKDKNRTRLRQYNRDYMRRRSGTSTPTRAEPSACESCGNESHRSLCLDHDHESGAFRGWLCFDCNMALGKLGDDLEGVLKLAAYLQKATQ